MKHMCPLSRPKTNIIVPASNCPALQRIENGAPQEIIIAAREHLARTAPDAMRDSRDLEL